MTATLPIACLLLLGFLCQWLAWRVKLPAILFLLLAGLVLGPVLGVVEPDRTLGRLLFPFVSLGVAIILFEGSLTLRIADIRGLGPAILNLVTLGAVTTVLGLATAAHFVAGLDWSLALLFGAICCVTGPTVIVPMLRSMRPNARIANVLRWEGIIIDALGALLAVLVFEALALDHGNEGVRVFLTTVAVGAVIGAIAALALAFGLRRHWVPEYLQNYATLALVLLTFAGANRLADESGLLAVTVMGMVLANLRGLHIEDILDFKEHLSTLVISMLFIVLAARIEWPGQRLLLAGLVVLIAAVFVIRPIAVLLGTLGSNLTWRERALIGWIAPRGIVAAAVSALFALRLEQRGLAGADALVPLTFLLIIGTVLISSATARPMARLLGVADPDPDGVLLIGASRVGVLLAEALKKQGFDVLVADDDWWGIRRARMAGLRTYFGSPVSEHADRHLDLVGIGRLLATSTRRELNTLACVRYRPEFGKDHVSFLRNVPPEHGQGKIDFAQPLQAPRLFGEQVTHGLLEGLLDDGWVIKHTRLTESFGWETFLEQYETAPLLLFLRSERGKLRVATAELMPEPKPGDTIVALVDPKARKQAPDGPEALAEAAADSPADSD